eukprot:GEMP01008032.1.p1 GENE.GEMP01008032.1~~GEMP01008032.1.p1  ORF type:complete len:906 (+),score=102.71 GEMP01008032.1:163-2880(+)
MKPWWTTFLKWAGPVLVWAIAFFIEVVSMCISSHYYLLWMHRITERASNQDAWTRDWMMFDANRESGKSTSEGALYDIVFNFFGDRRAPPCANILQCCLPGGMLMYVMGCCCVKDKYGEHNSRVWTKVCIVAAFLCLIKGTIFLVTVIPDSRGWSTCQKNMSLERQDFYKLQLNFKTDFWISLAIAIGDTCKQFLRALPFANGSFSQAYCSEAWSLRGSSAFIILLCLASIEMTVYVTHQVFGKHKFATYDENKKDDVLIVLPQCFGYLLSEDRLYTKRILRFFITFFWAGACTIHIYWMFLARQIYTMEFLLDLLFVMLLYTNVAVATFVYQWTGRKDITQKQVSPEFPLAFRAIQSDFGTRSSPNLETSPLTKENKNLQHGDTFPFLRIDNPMSKFPATALDSKDTSQVTIFPVPSMDSSKCNFFGESQPDVAGEIMLPPCCPLKLCESGQYHVAAENSGAEFQVWVDQNADVCVPQVPRGCCERMLQKVLCKQCVDVNPEYIASSGQPNVFVCVAKWCVPFLAFVFCFYLQNVGLHIGTHYYIRWMKTLHKQLSNTIEAENQGMENLSSRIGEGSLHDVFADYLGFTEINLIYLDVLTVIIPMAWTFGTIYTRSVTLWTKCWCCACCLALGKGIMAFSTVIPDSIGWSNCKERLGSDGIFLYDHGFTFRKRFWNSLAKLMTVELFGKWNSDADSYVHYRFCADMMYSGHTYILSLFCLGIYELMRTCLFGDARDPDSSTKEKMLWRRAVYYASVLFLLGVVGCELILVVRNRFHYTMDILVSLMLVLLYFTNLWIVIMAGLWTTLLKPAKSNRFRGDVTIPICCVPFSMIRSSRSRWFIYERTQIPIADYSELDSFLGDRPSMSSENQQRVVTTPPSSSMRQLLLTAPDAEYSAVPTSGADY